MRIPSGVEASDAPLVDDPSDYLQVDVTDAQGTVTVLHRWPANAPAAAPAEAGRLRDLLRLARPAADAVAALVALLASGLLFGDQDVLGAVVGHLAIAASFPIALALFGAYRGSAHAGAAVATAGIGVAAFGAAVTGSMAEPAGLAGRLVLFVAVLAVAHGAAAIAWSQVRRSPRVARLYRVPTAVVGATDDPDDLTDILGSVESELTPVAMIDHRSGLGRDGAEPLTTTVDRVLRDSGAGCLLVVDGAVPTTDLDALRRVARLRDTELRLLVRTPETFPDALRIRALDGHAIVTVPKVSLGGGALVAKRVLDLVLGSVALVLTAPFMIAIGIAIKATSPGPVLFRQDRVTKGGRTFRIVKFRTMEHAVEPEADTTRPFFKMHEDPRLTRVGRVIRTLSLDELPQLWNVLKGEMSLVGPRPLPREQVLAHPELLGSRHEVAPGMTGWWQVNGRSDLPAEEAVAYDRFYIENWSIGLDLRIILKTIAVLLTRRGAY